MSKDLPEHASVVVIGGGVIGTSIAFHLAESGVTDVVLVEKDELACGSTCKAAGGVRASFSNAANIAIGLRGLEVYSRFAQDYGQEIDFTRDGYLYLLSDQTNVEVFTESVALQNSLGVPSRMVTPEEAKKISPLIILALSDALDLLAAEDPIAASLAKIRIFAGLSVDEAGTALGLPHTSAYRQWTYAQAWLQAKLRDAE